MNIKCKNLIALLECNRKYDLHILSLKGGNDRYLYIHQAICRMADMLAQSYEISQIEENILTDMKQNYQEKWFSLSWQKKRAIEKDIKFFHRFLWGFLKQEAINIRSNQRFEVPVSLYCNDHSIDGISVEANLILEHKNEMVTGIIICRKFPKPYSYHARKKENMITNSPELLGLMYGLKQTYPQHRIEVMMIRLISPADKEGEMKEFEQKKGDNIISFTEDDYNKYNPKGILVGIKEAVNAIEPCKCKDCIYEEICKPANKVRLQIKKESKPKQKISFSEAQQKVIAHINGPIRVCAGPGSGKTAVLTERIHTLLKGGIPPDKILAVTFTKKAADEMLQRIVAAEKPQVLTLHALAFQILMQNEYVIGQVRLAGKVDCMNLLLKVLEYAPILTGVSYDGLTTKYGLIVNLLKDFEQINKVGVDAFAVSFPKKNIAGILQIKDLYDAAFQKGGYITFDDQIEMAVKLLEENPGVLKTVQELYDFIMVDEAQDLDAVQARFVMLLTKTPEHNLMIVGDADQSIYSFRGGSNHFLLHFKELYPEAEDIFLDYNYRSSKELVVLASSLISHNQERVPMDFKASFSTGFPAIHIANFNSRKLYLLIEEVITKGYHFEDIAIIATTNNALSALCDMVDTETARTGKEIPIERPKYYLKDDYVFTVLLDLLTLKEKGMNQDIALYRILVNMGCEIHKVKSKNSIYEDHLERGLIYNFSNEEASRYFVADPATPLIAAYGKIYWALQVLNLPLKQAIDELESHLFEKDFCIAEVFDAIKNLIYERKIQKRLELYELMAAMKLFQDDTRLQYDSGERNQVHMLTAHDAKGKEYPVVIIYEIDNFEREQVAEEENRRLLYVALTRAKRVLFLTENYPNKSQFLKEIKDYLVINRGKRYA